MVFFSISEEKKCVQTLKDDPNDLEVADILLNESSEMKTLPTLDDDVQKSATIDLEWKEKKAQILEAESRYVVASELIGSRPWKSSTWLVKFIYSENATKFCEISTLNLTTVDTVKSKVEISQNFVAFSEYMNCNSFYDLKRENGMTKS